MGKNPSTYDANGHIELGSFVQCSHQWRLATDTSKSVKQSVQVQRIMAVWIIICRISSQIVLRFISITIAMNYSGKILYYFYISLISISLA